MKTNNPICPYDLEFCDFHEDISESGCMNCHNCDRSNNNVRATGNMPGLEGIINWILKLFKK